MEPHRMHYIRKAWIYVICLLITLDCYFHILVYYDELKTPLKTIKPYHIFKRHHPKFNTKFYYKYPLVSGGDVLPLLDFKHAHNSSYYWFTSLKHLFKDIGAAAMPRYSNDTPPCKLNCTSFEPITVDKTEPKLDWIEQQNPDVKLGGYYAPTNCRATSKVAVIIPYRDRSVNLKILLRYLHPLLQKQLLEYRIFVIEQFGTEKFNKGSLYNIAFLETQRFGAWNCLVLYDDVDLVPEHEGISYSCPQLPKNSSPTIHGYRELYRTAVGSVTAVAPKDYEATDGYSNSYWGSGGVVDFYNRFCMPGPTGLRTTKYYLLNVTEEKLYTHILADVSEIKIIEERIPEVGLENFLWA